MSWLDEKQDKLYQALLRNPLLWIVTALLALSLYNHYQISATLTEVCKTVLNVEEERRLTDFKNKWWRPSYEETLEACNEHLAGNP